MIPFRTIGKTFANRAVTPETTLAAASPQLEAAGITRIAVVTGLDRIGLPVVMVARPNSRSVAVSAGKGLTLAAAKASGVMEAIESWHAETIDRPLRYLNDGITPGGMRMVANLARLPLFAAHDPARAAPLVWIEALEAFSGEPVLIPFELASADFARPRLPGFGLFLQSTNGLASGNVFEEAVVHALSELVERDGLALWHRAEPAARARCRVAPATLSGEAAGALLAQLDDAGFEIALWSIATEIGLAAFYAALIDRREPDGHFGVGAGCHPARETALLRALTEAVQVRMTYVSGARDDIARFEYRPVGRRRTLEALKREIALAEDGEMLDFAALPSFDSGDIGADATHVLDRLAAAGLGEAYLIELTKPGVGVAVARAIVPGLFGPEAFPGELHVPRTGARLAALA